MISLSFTRLSLEFSAVYLLLQGKLLTKKNAYFGNELSTAEMVWTNAHDTHRWKRQNYGRCNELEN